MTNDEYEKDLEKVEEEEKEIKEEEEEIKKEEQELDASYYNIDKERKKELLLDEEKADDKLLEDLEKEEIIDEEIKVDKNMMEKRPEFASSIQNDLNEAEKKLWETKRKVANDEAEREKVKGRIEDENIR